jgi:hypothetical protein
MTKAFYFLSIPLIAGCVTDNPAIYDYRLGHYSVPSGKGLEMPKEGWATDPILSYRMYSYYPIDYQNYGIPGHMGFNGLYYH